MCDTLSENSPSFQLSSKTCAATETLRLLASAVCFDKESRWLAGCPLHEETPCSVLSLAAISCIQGVTSSYFGSENEQLMHICFVQD